MVFCGKGDQKGTTKKRITTLVVHVVRMVWVVWLVRMIGVVGVVTMVGVVGVVMMVGVVGVVRMVTLLMKHYFVQSSVGRLSSGVLCVSFPPNNTSGLSGKIPNNYMSLLLTGLLMGVSQ